jgi:outer membrane receptor protein involved in Fe transport
MTLRLDATHLDNWTFDGNDFSGQSSTDNGTLPHWRGNVRAVYDRGPFQASINWNYIGTVDERPGDGGDTVVPGWSYVDLSGKYQFAEKYTVALGVTNVFDKGAPLIITGFTNTNTDNTTYDLIGRRYTLSIAAKF